MKQSKNTIADWLDEHGDPEIRKKYEELDMIVAGEEKEDWFKQAKNNPPSFWKKLKWKLDDVKYWPRNLKLSIKSIWYWFPIIWKDRNWDHRYIYTILQHKLKAQSKYIGERGIHLTAKRDAEIMMTCVRLIDKVADEFYATEYMDYFVDLNWFEPYKDKEGYSTWESKTINDHSEQYFEKYPLTYRKVIAGDGYFKIEYDFRKPGGVPTEVNKKIAMNIAHINQQRAHDLLFKIIKENINKWWD